MAFDDAGVVLEGDPASLGIGRKGVGDQLEQGFFILLPVDNLFAPEKAVPGMFRVGVVEIHDLDDGRIAMAVFDKVAVVQLPVPLVHGDAGDVEQAVRPFAHQVDFVDRLGHDAGFKGGQRARIDAFGHPVVMFGEEGVDRFAFGHEVAAGTLHTADAVESHGAADGDQVGRPGSGEVQPGADLDHSCALQLRREGHGLQKKAISQD